MLTVPSQLGVEYNAAMLATIAGEIAPAIGWRTQNDAAPEKQPARDGVDHQQPA
jgi:hypothetical protein